MTKNELVASVAEKASVPKKAVADVLSSIGEVIAEAMVAGDKVTLNGIGTFEVVDVPEKTGVIRMGARKGETYTKPAHKAPKFKMSGTMRKLVIE